MAVKYRKAFCGLLLLGIIVFGAGYIISPLTAQAASKKTTRKAVSGKKKEKRYFKHAGFEWDNRYMEVGKRIDLSSFVKGTTGLSKKARARLIKWKSYNTDILSINRYGIAKPKKAGTCQIRCRMKTKNGWKKVSKTIKVFDSQRRLNPEDPHEAVRETIRICKSQDVLKDYLEQEDLCLLHLQEQHNPHFYK